MHVCMLVCVCVILVCVCERECECVPALIIVYASDGGSFIIHLGLDAS